jgi:hypothetical protein
VDRLGPDRLARARFRAVPRGGVIVLGQLAYLLGLRPAQLGVVAGEGDERDAADAEDGPLVLVDDCAISGLRLHELVRDLPDREIVVALLFAHPDLRAALGAAVPAVVACAAGADLHDHAPDRLGADHGAWRARWDARGHGLWSGLPDYLCLPWNEPDQVVWDDRAQRPVATWRLAPPERCAKNRAVLGHRPAVTVHGADIGALTLAPGVLQADVGDAVLLVPGAAVGATAGAVVRLEGVAADLWRAAAGDPDLRRAAAAVAADYDVDAARVTDDLATLLGDLTDRGLLAVAGPPAD